MPIYEYACDACGHRFERIQKFSDDPVRDCPACSQSAAQRLISAPAFHLKGTGWYATDFKGGNGAKKGPEKESPAASPGAACGAGACPACAT